MAEAVSRIDSVDLTPFHAQSFHMPDIRTAGSIVRELECHAPGSHYRYHFSPQFADGHGEVCMLSKGMLLYILDAELTGALSMNVLAPDIMRIRIATDGNASYTPPDGRNLSLSGPNVSIIVEPTGVKAARADLTERQKCVQLYVSRGTLETIYRGNERELPDPVRRFMTGTLDYTFTAQLPLRESLLKCLSDTVACSQSGRTRQLFFQSKALEILCHTLDGLQAEDRQAVDVSSVAHRSLIKARDILKQDFVSPPALDDLAQQVGMSRSRLCSGFRILFDQTVFEYIHELRMSQALRLLQEGRESISEIAYMVGYNYVSSFSAAIHKHFGSGPRDLRRRSRGDM